MNVENLDTIKQDIEQHIRDNNFAMFRGMERSSIDRDMSINWDTVRFPDFKDFLAVASTAGVKIIVFHYFTMEPAQIKILQQHLDESDMDREEKRILSRELQRLKIYEGFVASVDLSFDLGTNTYLFSLTTSWQMEMELMMERLDPFTPDFMDAEDEKDGPIGGGGFYSRN